MWPSIGLPGQGTDTKHQAMFVRARDGALDAKFIGLSGFALEDVLHLWRMQRVQLVLVVLTCS